MSLSPPVLIRLGSSSWSISQWKFQEAEFHVSKTVISLWNILDDFGHSWWQYLSYSPLGSPSQTSWGDECCLLPACRGVGWHGPHGPSAESWRCWGGLKVWISSILMLHQKNPKKNGCKFWRLIHLFEKPQFRWLNQTQPASLSFFSIDVVLHNVWGVRVQTITASTWVTSRREFSSATSEILQHLLNSWSFKWWHPEIVDQFKHRSGYLYS